MSIILCMSFCIVLFEYFLSITNGDTAKSVFLVPLWILKMSWCGEGRWKTFQQSTRLQELWPAWRQLYIEQVKCHGDHFDAWSLPSRLRFFSGMGPRSRSFQRLTSHFIALHYPRHRNLIQFGSAVDAWRTAEYDFAQCPQNLLVIALKPCLKFTGDFVNTCVINCDTKVVFWRLLWAVVRCSRCLTTE